MPPEVCPLLGTLDDTNNPCPPVEYPSFENHCLVSDDRDTLLLADQASYCLSGGHVVCPRYQIASAARRGARVDPRVAAELTGGTLVSDQLRPELMASAVEGDERAASRRWAWLGTGMLFIMLMLCGSVFAVWSGWQQVQGYLAERTEGSIASIASLGSDQPAYVIITATPDPLVVAAAPNSAAAAPAAQQAIDPAQAGAPQSPQTGNNAQQFPLAVTATPASGAPALVGSVAQPPQVAIAPVDPEQNVGGFVTGNSQDPPNVLLEVPTRRPTPFFDIPTSTAVVETPTEIPTSTPTPTPMGTPSVVFGPAQQLVAEGSCTIISWQVLNVREVYYENIGVDGRGQAEECVDDVLEVYHLVVVFPDGASQTYTTTVTMLRPTDTPQPTATFTPFVPNTPTWTPEPPTATATPVVRYGALINVSGSTQQECAPGETCTFNLVIMNTGDMVDTLLVTIAESGGWSAELCRADGVCATSNLAISNMGSGNTATVALNVFVPADGAGSARYGVTAASSGSNGSVTSDVTWLDINVQ